MTYEVEVEIAELLAAMDALGADAQPYVDRASEVTANRIALEMRSRVRRRTGRTQAGIVVEPSRFGGWVVISGNDKMPNLPYWIEKGTIHQPPRPYREPAVELERGPHDDRISEALQTAIREKGLGD